MGRRRSRRGLTLLEAIMTMVIILVVVAGVMIMYQNANDNRRMTTATTQISNITQAIRSVFASHSNFTGLTDSTIINVIPTSQIAGTQIRHSYAGRVTVAPLDIGRGANSGFSITYQNLPLAPCSQLALHDFGRSLLYLRINGVVAAPPVPPMIAQANCQDSGANVIDWVFE